MTTKKYISDQTKCPSCGELVYPIINIKDDELFHDYAWAECPECHFCTGDRENELDALRFFENPGRPQPWSIENPVADYEQVFEDFWKRIVLAEDGSPRIDQIKRELFDAHTFMDGAAKVYVHITGGMISKVTTDPSCVIQVADEHYEELHREWEEEERTVTSENLHDYLMEWVKKNNVPYVEPWCLSFIQDLSKKAKSEIIEDKEVDLADWLWMKLMDWCKRRGVAPANYNDLFYIVKELRSIRK
jgi:hypothetical protein